MIRTRHLFTLGGLCALLAALSSAPWEATRASGSGARKRAQSSAPTFNKEVVRILQQNCQTCHHPGDIAPFSMLTFKETRPWAQAIREQVILRKMPPWKPVPGCGDFRDARRLSDADVATLAAWVDAGAPEGNPADLPPPVQFPDGWPLGEPDLILTPESEYTPPTTGDIYRCFTIPTALRGDRFVAAIDVKPGNRKIVHHVIAYLDPAGVSAQLDARDPGPGYTSFGGPGFLVTNPLEDFILGGWAPGARGYQMGEGNGVMLKQNARVVVQVHYHPTGEPESDRTEVGIYFAKTPVRKRLRLVPLINDDFNIPPGDKRHRVTASFAVPPFFAARIVSLTPHMHLLGREIKVEMKRPGGESECLIAINDWDFNWQGTYLLKEPIAVPSGTELSLTAYYDNSADNPRNPNSPPKAVRWGEETTDEMALAFVGATIDFENLSVSTPVLAEVALDQNNHLVVTGERFHPGADIEVNGHSLRDTTGENNRLASSEMWRVFAPPGQPVNVTVLNPDGARTPAKSFTRPGAALSLAAASAASFAADAAAPEAIVAAFGSNFAAGLNVAQTTPLPTQLGGTTVRVNGVPAPLFFVAPAQVNFLVPEMTQPGAAVIEITAGDGTLSRGTLTVTATAPGLFTANSQGNGAPAAVATADGASFIPAGNPDGTPNSLNRGDYLILFGTGFRRAATGTLRVTIGGLEAPILFAGAQAGFAGLDQINTQIPTGVSGVADLVLSVNGRTANVVRVKVKE